MRGLGRLAAATTSTAKYPFLTSSSHGYSTFSGGGRGRGRGAASPPPPISPGNPRGDDAGEDEEADVGIPGLGHGRGVPPPLPSFSFSSALNSPTNQSSGRGRGSLDIDINADYRASDRFRSDNDQEKGKAKASASPRAPPLNLSFGPPPGGLGRGKVGAADVDTSTEHRTPDPFRSDNDREKSKVKASEMPRVPLNLSFSAPRGGLGRGKVGAASGAPVTAPPEENRHLRGRIPSQQAPSRGAGVPRPRSVIESPPRDREEATRRAMDVLSRGGRAQGGRGMRGRGPGRGRGGRFGGRGQIRDIDEHYGTGLFLGENADGEKLAKRLGEENMAKLKEGFEEMSGSVLPSPMDECFLEALHTNYSFEFDPEYHMVFTNPDIEERPPISLQEALEKTKPFMMEYEGIKSQEEWEEVVKETMEKVPVLKELVDFYSGPDRVTAKQQTQELERVANSLPEDVPSSVKRFTDRALLSLQSNSGWGFGKKCQFMDKLTWEFSQQYKR